MPQALLALAGWCLFAFAGAYRWTIVPVMAVAAILALRRRPRVAGARHRVLDVCLLACFATAGLQLVPLPLPIRQLLSPAAVRAREVLEVGASSQARQALSLDPAATAWSLAFAVAMLLVYWTARDTFERDGGLRHTCRGIAWFGLMLAVVMFVQKATSPRLIYGFWAPITRTAVPSPFGPYVNRNDFACWLLLAIPVVLGYLVGHMSARVDGRRLPAAIEHALDTRSALLGGAVILMTAALVASLSRSGLAGFGAGLVVIGAIGRHRIGLAGSGLFATAMIVLLAIAMQYTDMSALAFRLGDGLAGDVDGRLAIWRETWAMARDFLGVGIGVGAFERGMLVYQQIPRPLFFNHAHNEYLQVLAEGGLLIGVPAAAAILAGGWSALRALRSDSRAIFWIRLGAVGGLVALAVQSVWDTGLRMPANGVLFALSAAIATHTPRRIDAPPATGSRRIRPDREPRADSANPPAPQQPDLPEWLAGRPPADRDRADS